MPAGGHIVADFIGYAAADRIATITLDRPDRRNAQNQQLLEELNDAWERAAADDAVRVILLRAEGPHFSAGHDISPEEVARGPFRQIAASIPTRGLLGIHQWEARHYLGFSRRWRDIPKPSIAAVQGACIAGGLLLAWPCDLIVAADDARFSDPVVLMGIGGVEYHGHTWELGARKAKEMLFTARPIDAQEAERRGMVNRVVPRTELDTAARALAAEIAQMHPHALAMAKRAVNQTLDIQGQAAALQSCFDIHQLGHASAYAQGGQFVLTDLPGMKGKD
ncbi:Enoyl-CoA hydratase/isomerase [Rhizorhabdus wittichii RW1]|uniref:Enoyl-CoA hydratase/isomerase n=1 Tax=Rhizorhabdus wittichii (strain DSM 6014 / CCUG 31198 / JCM 15750 / NBRC 105917 / EY 4224 / RW1) TaxID=392499 RepID=A0A9J9HBA6_RHIWR|nr:Enoyl-CoA hydratase/isomerase [Rhizorhabdus wittichii RW1]